MNKNKNKLLSMKGYLTFVIIVLAVYVYSMVTGWRFISFNEGSHHKAGGRRGGTFVRTGNYYYHK
jgi:hypothetical protein